MFSKDIVKKAYFDNEIISTNSNNEISDIVLNSKVADNSKIFVAIKGFKTNGHKYIQDAYKNGCRDFVVEDSKNITDDIKSDSTVIEALDTRKAIALISNFLNGSPSDKLNMIGVTGTKGKTTVVTLIHRFLSEINKVNMFTTVKNIVDGESIESVRTTMESNELQSLLKRSLDAKEEMSVVEVSSHAVTLKRVDGIMWNVGVFTSFSRDHLDLYGSMENYLEAKLGFFKDINTSKKNNKFVVINIDDPKGEDICNVINGDVRIIKVGIDISADYLIDRYEMSDEGIELVLKKDKNEFAFKTQMRGEFNIINISLAVATAMELGVKPKDIQNVLLDFKGVEGRFEIIIKKPFTVIIDYAHTPDSLDKILIEGKRITDNKLMCVFGCTGERDKDKRCIMGNVAAEICDFSIITNDDTYEEDPEKIAKEVEMGFIEKNRLKDMDYKIILNRKDAIKRVIDLAENGDVIVIAGMGHEKVQILAGGPVEYNDKNTVIEVLKEKDLY